MEQNSENQDTLSEDQEPEIKELFSWSRQKPWNKALSIFLMVAIIACIAATVYIVQTGKGESFTEFYILGLDGKADNYPSQLKPGESASVILGIVNHEYATVEYRVEITDNGTSINKIGPVTLAHEEKWENSVSFKPVITGDSQQIEFLLHKSIDHPTDNTTPLSLKLWVNVN
jgi:uncharacterized membrane protein